MDAECEATESLHVWWSRWASTLLGPASPVPHLLSQSSEPQEQEENIWSFLCSRRGLMWDFSDRVWLSVELFSAPPGLLRSSSASPYWLSFKD